ncbi:MAG: GTP cyclohydrolase I FolE [bacterium]|nr:GTP cyclohydrolase I FolE [bacterium]
MENLIKEMLSKLGEDPEREGLIKTPERVAKAYDFLTEGYRMDVEDIVNDAIFHESYDEMVIVKDIDFFSLCEHHMLPFFGVCHVAYIPDGKIIGLSKIARLVDMFSKRFQVQERMTTQIAETLNDYLEPKGVGVIATAQHLCMMMRGVQKQNAIMTTSSMMGLFKSDHRTRTEFLSLVDQSQKKV